MARHRHYHRPHHPYRRHSLISRVFYKFNRFVRRHPILSAVFSILISFILIRSIFVNNLFGIKVNNEFRIWIFIIALIFFIAGILALKVWFRRNVPSLFTKHDVRWRNR